MRDELKLTIETKAIDEAVEFCDLTKLDAKEQDDGYSDMNV